jgi:hypothetical protein
MGCGSGVMVEAAFGVEDAEEEGLDDDVSLIFAIILASFRVRSRHTLNSCLFSAVKSSI